jgi:hypothetical protein
MDERQIIKWLGENIPGYKDLVKRSKGKIIDWSRYADGGGNPIPKSSLGQYEIVKDRYTGEGPMPNPVPGPPGLIPLMLTGTLPDLAIETVATGIGEASGSGTAGAVGGLITSLATGRPPKKNIKAENKTLSYAKDNYYDGGYGNNTVLDDYLDYSRGYYDDVEIVTPKNKKIEQPFQNLPTPKERAKTSESLRERIARILSNESNDLQDPSSVSGLPRLNSDGTITELDAGDIDNALIGKYGPDNAVDFFKQGSTYDSKNTTHGLGVMRGDENLRRIGNDKEASTFFGRTPSTHVDMDRPNPLHQDKFVTMDNIGEAEERARKWVAQNPDERALSFSATPGGVSIMDIGQEGAKKSRGNDAIKDFVKMGQFFNMDPAYILMSMRKYSMDANKWFRDLPNSLKQREGLIDFLGSPQMNIKKGKRGYYNPWVSDMFGQIERNGNPFPNMNVDVWKSRPQTITQNVPFVNDIRLTAKTNRMKGHQVLGNEFTTTNPPAYVRQPLFTIGKDEAKNAMALDNVFGPKGLTEMVNQGRYVMGLQDPIRPDWGKGFGDTSHLNSIANELSPLGKAQMRDYLKLGLIGPAVYDNIMQNEQQE